MKTYLITYCYCGQLLTGRIVTPDIHLARLRFQQANPGVHIVGVQTHLQMLQAPRA